MENFDGKQISFDPHDWKGIAELCKRYKEFDAPWSGKNEEGEYTMISINKDNIIVETLQSNGWWRQNIYYPKDCTVEELYTK